MRSRLAVRRRGLPRPTLSSWTCFRALLRSSRWIGPTSPASLISSRLTNVAAADFTNLVDSVEQGYTAMPVVEETLASHLSPSLAPSWKSCAELSGQLAHSGSLQGASKSSQRYRSPPHPFSWPQNERQEECAPPISANRVSWGSFGFHSDAGPFGSCPDIQFYSMSDPLQARPSCLCRYLPQAVRPHGSGLPCVAPRVASHEAVPLVDERAEVIPHCTSHSPYQGVAQLLSTPFTMAGPCFSPERGENGCDPPSPNDHDGRINDGLGRGFRRQTGEWGMDRRVPFLAHKLPGTQGCLPGFDVFSPHQQNSCYHGSE